MSTNTCPFHTPRPARQMYSKLDEFLLHLRNVSAAAQQTCYSTTFNKYTVEYKYTFMALSRSLAGLHLLYTITSVGICTSLCSVVKNLGSGCQLWLEYHDPLPESPYGKFPVCPLKRQFYIGFGWQVLQYGRVCALPKSGIESSNPKTESQKLELRSIVSSILS